MPKKSKAILKWSLAAVALTDAWTDFVLSRRAMQVTPATLTFYQYTAGAFLTWAEQQGIHEPEDVTARHVRAYLAHLADLGRSSVTIHDHARAIKTLLRFWHAEGYMTQPTRFDMPRVEKKRLPVLTAEELQTVVAACNVRDKAIVLFLVDSGLRRQELVNLNWEDVEIGSGLVRVKRGKGRKDRVVVIGSTTQRALLKYRRSIDPAARSPLFQARGGTRFTGTGLLLVFRRLSKRTGIQVTPHILRRCFVIFSLRAGMNPMHLQKLGGWTSMSMVEHYSSLVDDDLLSAHKQFSPIDNLK